MATPKELEELFQMLPSSIAPRILDKKTLEKDLENANRYLIKLKAKSQVDWEYEFKSLIQAIKFALITVGVSPVNSILEYLEMMEKRLNLGVWT